MCIKTLYKEDNCEISNLVTCISLLGPGLEPRTSQIQVVHAYKISAHKSAAYNESRSEKIRRQLGDAR